jgi:anti-sigma B factor antagonist
MSETVNREDQLLVAIQKQCALVRVRGRGSFKNAPALKRFGVSAIEKGCVRIVLDMDECRGMDSTFMGVLAGLALRLQHEFAGQVVAINLTPKTLSLLETLGLTRLIDAHEAGAAAAELTDSLGEVFDVAALENPADDRRITLETMLEAHQNLVDATPDNLTRFKDVLTYLTQDLRQIQG